MTDLFSRIAERALGLAPIIQPMVTPFYAATQQQEDLPFETLAEVERDERQPGWQIGASGISGTSGTTAQQDAGEPERPREPLYLPEPARLPRSNDTNAPVPASTTRPQHARESEQPSFPEPTRRAQAPAQQPAPAYPLSQAPGHPDRGYPHAGYPQGVPLLYTFRLAGGEPWDSEAPHAVGVDRGRARIVGVPLAGTLGLEMGTIETGTRPRATPQQTGRHTNEAVPEVIQAAPTVHVTIGRIEVRATPAPAAQAPTARQQAAPKAMSLDEYLKQSGKGGRG